MISLLTFALQAAPIQTLALPPNDHATITVSLQFNSGGVDDPQGKAGITALAADVMANGGTQSLSAQDLLTALFPLATGIDLEVDRELTTFTATFHKDHLEAMTKILTDCVLHPRWDAHEFDRIRDSAVNDVDKRLRQNDDENLGKAALSELLYRGTPYARIEDGHVTDLRSITLDELRAHAQKVFTRARLVIGVAGGYPKTLPAKLAKILAALPEGTPAVAPVVAAKGPPPRLQIVEKETASSAISIGMPWALGRGDPDFVAMTIARSAFGEHRQFNGRLMNRLREARGLNYGDYAYLENYHQQGGEASTARTGRVRHQQEFSIWLRPVQNDNRVFALRAALYELQRSVSDEPFSTEEVARTKSFLAGYILLFAQTDARKLGYALDDRFLGLHDFLGGWRAKLASVTAEQVNAAWRKWVDPSRMQIVMVTSGASALKAALIAGTPSPMHYPKDAQGKAQAKPAALLATDAQVEKFPLGLGKDSDVEIVSAAKLFE
jgi:zinc protease